MAQLANKILQGTFKAGKFIMWAVFLFFFLFFFPLPILPLLLEGTDYIYPIVFFSLIIFIMGFLLYAGAQMEIEERKRKQYSV